MLQDKPKKPIYESFHKVQISRVTNNEILFLTTRNLLVKEESKQLNKASNTYKQHPRQFKEVPKSEINE